MKKKALKAFEISYACLDLLFEIVLLPWKVIKTICNIAAIAAR